MTLKTRNGVKKRIKITARGKFLTNKAWKRHLLSDKSKKAKRRNKYGVLISKSEIKKIKQQLLFT